MYDYIIIGGGIAGLYADFLLTKKYKTLFNSRFYMEALL